MHWATPYIGIPWQHGAEGPATYDCYGLVKHVQRAHFCRELPRFESPNSLREAIDHIDQGLKVSNWGEVLDPIDGDVALLARAQFPVHIGVVVRANGQLGLLHSSQPEGVIFQRLHTLAQYGWRRVRFYRPT